MFEAIYQVSSSVQSRTATRVKSRSEGTWAFWFGADHDVDGLTSFWELFCLSKMEGRPPQMRAMSRVLVLGSTILSFQREQRIHVLPARWFEVEWIFSAADSGITDCIFHIIVIAFVKESKTISNFQFMRSSTNAKFVRHNFWHVSKTLFLLIFFFLLFQLFSL